MNPAKLQPWALLVLVAGGVFLLSRKMTDYLLSPVAPGRMRNDPMGSGHFGAPRGGRTHKGVDIIALPGARVRAPFDGTVTKNGYVYEGNGVFRYVEIQHGSGDRVRVLYVDAVPDIVGRSVKRGDSIGTAQSIAAHHGGGMVNHVHLELIRDGLRIDPLPYITLVS